MGVYIKGMEMPKNCMLCPLCVEEADPANGEMCMVTGTLMPPCTRERLDNCPLAPVPPHGDLIDRDALMKILSKVIDINASIEQRNEATDQERRCLWWFEQQIGIAPTVIPAEEGET